MNNSPSLTLLSQLSKGSKPVHHGIVREQTSLLYDSSGPQGP